ncbi:hypothetical protein [Donghicola sp.]|jgi:hypothetical protein|uniref:hypothetical protein n=1 Tax=Donghicola sp. TaxID=1929294 RepID=UPI0025FFE5A1|nr:hypothetical protein [Donghicola sp.]MCT4578776.1 hypothetical protein [Donghicola sp.]
MTPFELYGTDAPSTPTELITLGDLSFTLEAGALRHITYKGVEMLRGIAFLVRDRDWGTMMPSLTEISRDTAGYFRLETEATYVGTATLTVRIVIEADTDGLTVRASGQSDGAFETNRAGFTILHPAAVAGCSAQISHSDGSTDMAPFPLMIEPWQPFMDITALTHDRAGLRVSCDLSGDTFEMEDQRQWGDASFKTYNRPLALPWPYEIAAGIPLEQSVRLTWTEISVHPEPTVQQSVPNPHFPETAIVITAADAEALTQAPSDLTVSAQRLLCHMDAALGGTEAQMRAFAGLQKAIPDIAYDLELICKFDGPVEAELISLRTQMDAAGFVPDSVLVCPSVDRQSTPPGSEWPDCPPLDEIHETSARVFSDTVRGGGMVSFFPELNRKRPPLEHLNFVSHSLCPIVHAADDLSVMETLQTLPHITRSARALMGECEYRLGPSTIGMRQNPYGSRTIPNPNRQRVCMADDDPRHRAHFGAAYTLGVATAIAETGIAIWTPAALYGPRGLTGPIVQVIAALIEHAGAPVHRAVIDEGIAELHVGSTKFMANLTPHERGGLPPYGWSRSPLAE